MEIGAVPLLVGIAGILVQRGLRNGQRIRWWIAGGSLIAIALAGLLLGHLGSQGGWGGVWAFILSLTTGVIAVVICVWLIWVLPRWRKLASFGFAAATALMVLVSWKLGNYYSPEATVERNAETIVQALEEYHTESSTYPAALDELVPVYLPVLPEAVTTQGTGWLYTSNGDSYTLGYWFNPRKFGVTLYLYSSENAKWEWRFTYSAQDWTPFSPVPTPTSKP
jgi:hypothetical protein